MRRFSMLLSAVAVAALLAPAAADARVVVVAAGDGSATLTDVDHEPRRRPRAGRRAGRRGATVAPDGTRAYVAAGRRVVAVDLTTRTAGRGGARCAGRRPRSPSRPTAARSTPPAAARSTSIDAATLAVVGSIALPRRATPSGLAVSADGTRAAAVLSRRRVVIVNLLAGRIARRVAVAGAGAVAFAPAARDVWVSATARGSGRLYRFSADGRLLARHRVGRGVGGGGLVFSPTGRFAVVGAAGGASA